MKNRYQRLSKEEKKQAKERYMAISEDNKTFLTKQSSVRRICYVGLVIGIIFIIQNFVTHDHWFFYIEYGGLLIFSVVFLLFSQGAIESTLNKFLIEEMKEKKNKEKEKESKGNSKQKKSK